MFTMLENTVIGKPLEEVFAFVSDIENDTLYRKDILEAKWVSEGPIREGRTFRHVLNLMGKKEFEARISKYEKNKHIEIEYLSGSIRPTYLIKFESEGPGTKIIHHSTVKTFGLFRLMEPLMPGMGKSRLKSDYLTLKNLLENKSS